MDVCPYDAAAIRSRCEKMLPSLTQAETLQHCVGLRPHREGNVRIEVENNSLFPTVRKIVSNIMVKNFLLKLYNVATDLSRRNLI